MKIAENRYIRRKISLHGSNADKKNLPKLRKDYETVVNGQDREVEEFFNPQNKFSIEKKYRREILKKSSCMGKKLQRYFEMTDEHNFEYYREVKGGKSRKSLSTEEFKCEVQTKRDVGEKDKKAWDSNKDIKDKKKRLQIGIKTKKNKYKYVYFYSGDDFEITYLKLQIEYKLLEDLKDGIHAANQIFKASICSQISDQMENAPVRKSNFA